jgi:hypothetical protein
MVDDKVRLFYSYSHKDELFRDELETHLAIFKRRGLVEEGYDRKITPGHEWDSEIDDNISKADIILLLVSSDFIASDYCYGKELNTALTKVRSWIGARGYLGDGREIWTFAGSPLALEYFRSDRSNGDALFFYTLLPYSLTEWYPNSFVQHSFQ